MPEFKNIRYKLVCLTCKKPLEYNESYDFRVHMYKTEGYGIWCFIDNEVDLSGMTCACSIGEEDWDAIEL